MAKVSIATFGCTANQHDSEIMAGILSERGHSIARNGEADAVIVNVCTVKGDAKAFKEIKGVREKNPGKRIVVTGCTTPRLKELVRDYDNSISLMSTHQIGQIADVVEGCAPKPEERRPEKILLPRIRKNTAVAIVLISEGCLNYCSFCSTKLIKGKVHSYAMEDILETIRKEVALGAREVWITSQDSAAYGVDRYKRFAFGELMLKIAKLRGSFFVRMGMGNPDNVKRVLPQLLEALDSKNMFKFIHIPVQAGSNRVLREMNRTYKAEDFIETVKKLRSRHPRITLSTDIIVGFPTETEEEFEETLGLVRETRPQIINISRYAARPGTRAAEMPQLPDWVKKERSRKLTRIYEEMSLEENKRWVGWEGIAVVDEEGKNGTVQARNPYYKPIVIKGKHPLGEIVQVRVTGAKTHYLEGEVAGAS